MISISSSSSTEGIQLRLSSSNDMFGLFVGKVEDDMDGFLYHNVWVGDGSYMVAYPHSEIKVGKETVSVSDLFNSNSVRKVSSEELADLLGGIKSSPEFSVRVLNMCGLEENKRVVCVPSKPINGVASLFFIEKQIVRVMDSIHIANVRGKGVFVGRIEGKVAFMKAAMSVDSEFKEEVELLYRTVCRPDSTVTVPKEEKKKKVVYRHSCADSSRYHRAKYKHWAKRVVKVDITRADGFSFIGEFLKVDRDNMVPEHSVVVEVCGEKYSAYRVSEDGKVKLCEGLKGRLAEFVRAVSNEVTEQGYQRATA